MNCSNFGPVSLLYIDFKLLAKILAYRLLSKMIGPEQVGLMHGREARGNIIKASKIEGLFFVHGCRKGF